jgi:hypothetical protein
MIYDYPVPDTYQIELYCKSNQTSTISYPKDWYTHARELIGSNPILIDIFYEDGMVTTIYIKIADF